MKVIRHSSYPDIHKSDYGTGPPFTRKECRGLTRNLFWKTAPIPDSRPKVRSEIFLPFSSVYVIIIPEVHTNVKFLSKMSFLTLFFVAPGPWKKFFAFFLEFVMIFAVGRFFHLLPRKSYYYKMDHFMN